MSPSSARSSRQRCNSHPVLTVPHINVVCPHKSEFPIVANPKEAQVRRNDVHTTSAFISHRTLCNVVRDEKLAARIESYRACMQSVSVDTLNLRWFAGSLVDSEDDDRVLPSAEDRFTLEVHGATSPIDYVYKLA